MKVKVLRYTVLESNLYEVYGEDGPLHVFDSEVVAIVEGGYMYGNNLIVTGAGRDEEGYHVPNRSYKEECLAILGKLKSQTEIDDVEWYLISNDNHMDLEARMEHEALVEYAERHGHEHTVQHLTPPPMEASYAVDFNAQFEEWRGDSDGSVGLD